MTDRLNARILAVTAGGGLMAIMLGLAWFNHQGARESTAAREGVEKKQAGLDAGIRRAEEEIAEIVGGSAKIQIAGTAKLRSKPARAAAGPGPELDQQVRLLALAGGDPKLYALGVEAFQAGLPLRFGPLFKALNLAPAQIGKFESLASGHEEAQADIIATAAAQGVAPDDPAVALLINREDDQYQAAQRALLGEPGYRQLQQFDRIQPVGGIVDKVAVDVALTSTPLSDVQSSQLEQILAGTSSQFQGGGPATPETIDWPAALAQARPILAPAQFTALGRAYATAQIAQFKAKFDQEQMTSP